MFLFFPSFFKTLFFYLVQEAAVGVLANITSVSEPVASALSTQPGLVDVVFELLLHCADPPILSELLR